MASNFFPILSSSPPPLDDEDSVENDDDDEFGIYTSVLDDSSLNSPVSGVPVKYTAEPKYPQKSHILNQKNSIKTLVPPESVHGNTFISDDYVDFEDFTSHRTFDEISEHNLHQNNIVPVFPSKARATIDSKKSEQETSTSITLTCSTQFSNSKSDIETSAGKFSICNNFKALSQNEAPDQTCSSLPVANEIETCSLEEEDLDFDKRSPITRQLSPRSEQQDNTSQESVPDSGLCNSSQHSETSPPPLSEGVFSDTSPEKEPPLKNFDNSGALSSVSSKLDLEASFNKDICGGNIDTPEHSVHTEKSSPNRSDNFSVSEECVNLPDNEEYGAFIVHNENKSSFYNCVNGLELPSHHKENCVVNTSDVLTPLSQSEDFSLVQDMSNNTCLSSDQSHFETARTSPSSSGSIKDGVLQDSSFPEDTVRTCTHIVLNKQCTDSVSQYSFENNVHSDNSIEVKYPLSETVGNYNEGVSENFEEDSFVTKPCDRDEEEFDSFHQANESPISVEDSLPATLPVQDDFGDFETGHDYSSVDDFADFEQAQEELAIPQESTDFENAKLDSFDEKSCGSQDNFADFEHVSFEDSSLHSEVKNEGTDNFVSQAQNLPQVEANNSRAAQLIIAAFPTSKETILEDSTEHVKETDYESILLEQHSKSRRLWDKLQDLDQAPALHFQWGISHSFQQMLRSVSIDYHSILRTSSVPIFACGLQLLEPTKGPLAFNKQEVEEKPSQTQSPKEPIPPVHFDWNGSGLVNPLDSGHATSTLMDLSFLANAETLSSKPSTTRAFSLEDEFLGPTSELSSPEKCEKPPLLEKLLSLSAATSLPQSKKGLRPSTISGEANQVLNKLPDLSFMRAKVLMFPLRNNT